MFNQLWIISGGGSVILLSDENIFDFVKLPEYIINKYKKGYITRQQFSDIIRLNLLIEYGGTWVDATMFATGETIPEYMLKSDLFVFQTTFLEQQTWIGRAESYYISAHSHNKILTMCRDLLYAYWRKYNIELEYFIFYEMFEIALHEFPEEWSRVVHYPRSSVLEFAAEWWKPYDHERMNEFLSRYPLHKLSYKMIGGEGSCYDYIVNHFKKYGDENTVNPKEEE